MSNVVIFNASPRKNGYTAKLLQQLVKGVESKGGRVQEFDLNHEQIRGCQGCFYCRTHKDCAVQDYLQPMYQAIAKAGAIVFASPIYYYQITGQARVWMDRTFPMIESQGQTFSPRYPGKKLITIFTQGALDPKISETGRQFAEEMLISYGWDLTDRLHCCGTSGTLDPAVFDTLAVKAYQAGADLIEKQ